MQRMAELPDGFIDLIFADPPYNLQLRQDLHRPDQSKVAAVRDDWDQFESFQAYDEFSKAWLLQAKRILKDTGSLWVIGSYHNIYRLGGMLQDLGFWILNDVVWAKPNAMPNFRGTRLQNSTETMLWCSKSSEAKPQFNYQALKNLNEDKQMNNVWHIPICQGAERIKIDGTKAHATQKPLALLYPIILGCSQPGDLVLDPFLGSGTTAVAAATLGRDYIGIDQSAEYLEVARARLAAVQPQLDTELLGTPNKRDAVRIPFGAVVAAGLLPAGTLLQDGKGKHQAIVKADGQLLHATHGSGSIHQIGARVQNLPACNGWDYWHAQDDTGTLHPIDHWREKYRAMTKLLPKN